jgi:hypothetical protein
MLQGLGRAASLPYGQHRVLGPSCKLLKLINLGLVAGAQPQFTELLHILQKERLQQSRHLKRLGMAKTV